MKKENKKSKKRTNSFTLVELLAVIIILGVIALIVFPVVDNSIKTSKEKSLEITIDNIEQAAYNYSVENDLGQPNVEDKMAIMVSKMQQEGFLETGIINPVTDEEMQGCVWYYWDDSVKQYDFEYDQECELQPATLTITYDKNLLTNGWLKANMLVNLNGTGDRIKYCISNSECTPSIEERMPSYSVGISNEGTNVVCAVAINGLGTSEKVCESLKLDKTPPTISGVNDLVIMKDESIDLQNGVTYDDTLSGLDGGLLIEPSTIDTSTVGTKQVKYQVRDKAGNIREVIRNIIVDADAPTITFALLDSSSINSNGWAKSDFYVRATVTDNSGTGIKSAASCTTNTTGECTPTGTFTGNIKDNYITTEGSNRICIQVTDNNNKTTKICSDTYKLDKTLPVIGGVDTLTVSRYQTVNLTSGVTYSDSPSGIDGTLTVTPSSISTSKAGTYTVTYQVKDRAGNVRQTTRNIIVDAPAPTITYSSSTSANTWVSSNITLNATITDNSGTGISSMKSCQTNSTSSCTPTSTFTGTTKSFTISTNGNNRVCIQVTDNNGKTSTQCSSTYKLDKTTPTITFARTSGTSGLNGWYTSSVGVRTSATTGSSGLSSLKTCTTTSTSSCTPTSTTTTRTLSTNSSTNRVCAQATSVSGKSSGIVCSSYYKIDTVKPTCSLTKSGTLGSSSWYRSNVTVSFSSTYDSTSGVYQKGIGDYTTISRTQTVDTSGTTYTGYVRDYAGNTNTCTTTVKRDTVAPTATLGSSYLNGITSTQTQTSTGKVYNLSVQNKSCSGSTCTAKICLKRVVGDFQIRNVKPTFTDARSGYYSYSYGTKMYDKNGNVVSGCKRTEGHNPCRYAWTYSYRDYAGNTNTFTYNFTIDYEGFNSCA